MRLSALVSVAAIVLAACAEDVRVGDRCEYSSECPAPLRCSVGRCRAECRVNVDCPLGALCRIDGDGVGSCSLEDDPECASDAECGDGLVCVSTRCMDACASDGDCAGGNECWSVAELGASFCVDPRQRPDGGMPASADAGLDAEVSPDAHAPPDAQVATDGGQPCAGAACDAIVDVALAHGHACALTRGGAVWCWGSDELGEASASLAGRASCGGVMCRTAPTRIPLLGEAVGVQLALGTGHACARMRDETVQCWGSNASGALGRTPDGPAVGRAVAVGGIGSLGGVTSLVSGNSSVIAVTSDLVGWGENRLDELRDAPAATLPTTIAAGPVTLTMGGLFACALRGTEARCWGASSYGQLGRALLAGETSSPDEAAVEGLTLTPASIVAGAARSCAIDAAGTLECWGHDPATGDAAPPAIVGYEEPIVSLWSAPSSAVFCGLAGAARTPVCFGRADAASFWPDGGTVVRSAPVPMHGALPTEVTKITTDAATGCAVGATGELWCWGANDRGQLAQGTSGSPETTPVRVVIPTG